MIIIGILIVIGFITVVVFILSLFFGGEDPYERELAEMDRHDELLDALYEERHSNNSVNIVDARSIHLHNDTYNIAETNKNGTNLSERNKRIRQAQSNIDRSNKEYD